jgi:gluconokinase
MPTIDLDHAESPLILTLDLGSSSTRAMLFDTKGRAVEGIEARQTHALHTAADGTSEDDAEALQQRAVAVIDRALQSAGRHAGDIGAVAMDTYVTNILGVDESGKPVTPVYTYADTRPTEDATQLRQQFDETEVQQRTGCLLRSSYLPARFKWLQRTQPDTLKRVQRWLSVGEFLLDRFFGQTFVSSSLASWSGLVNRRALDWDEAWFESLPVRANQFSHVVDASDSMSSLKPEWARRWPALADILWLPAIGDGAAANLGSGCTSPDRIALTIGTSGALRSAVPGTPDRVPAGLWCYRIDRNTSLLGGATSEGGNVYAWLRQTLSLVAEDEFDRVLATLDADGHGLTALPFITGERSPGYAGDNARAAITGLTISTQPIEIARALLEAVAYRFALIARHLNMAETAHIVASGGGLVRSPAWLQIFADVLNRPVYASTEKEATSRGDALMALRSLGVMLSFDDLPADLGEMYQPDPARQAVYLNAIERQQELYELLVKRDV